MSQLLTLNVAKNGYVLRIEGANGENAMKKALQQDTLEALVSSQELREFTSVRLDAGWIVEARMGLRWLPVRSRRDQDLAEPDGGRALLRQSRNSAAPGRAVRGESGIPPSGRAAFDLALSSAFGHQACELDLAFDLASIEANARRAALSFVGNPGLCGFCSELHRAKPFSYFLKRQKT